MKKIVFVFGLMLAMVSCSTATNDSTTVDTVAVDTIATDTTTVDSIN